MQALISVLVGGLIATGMLVVASAPVAEGGTLGAAVQHHRPTWLPDGVREWSRGAARENRERWRRWKSPGRTAMWSVAFRESADTGFTQEIPRSVHSEPVEVGGLPGVLITHPGLEGPERLASVEWIAATGEKVVVDVYGPPGQSDVALRVARSAVRAETLLFGDPVRLGWLPEGGHDTWFTVEGESPDDWRLHVITNYPSRRTPLPAPTVDLLARCGVRDASDDEYHVSLLKVRGASGRLIVPKGRSVKWTITTLQVRLDDGRCLEVRTSTGNERDMVRIADSLQIKSVDTSWLGRH